MGRDSYFGDSIYDVWRRGGNPDRIDADRADDAQARGVPVEDFTTEELYRQRVLRRHPRDHEFCVYDDEA